MYKFPCPWCNKALQVISEGQVKKVRCPKCEQISYPLARDEVSFKETFPLFEWGGPGDSRGSREHLEMAKCGVNGTNYFDIDDPIFSGWWTARRKNLRPCRCMIIEINKWQVARLRLEALIGVFVDPPPFDPWRPENNCELLAWGNGSKLGWPDENYTTHPGNPELRERLE